MSVIPANAGIHRPVSPMSPKQFWVYMLASPRNGTLYIGATSNLIQRIHQHKTAMVDGFTERYSVTMLVWFEEHATAYAMATRERRLKAWKRQWKVELIEARNPGWLDLYLEISGLPGDGSRRSPG
jgi:putative endonuclease